MTQTEKEKIKRFLSDKTMSDAVYLVLQDTFLNEGKDDKDIHVLAAAQLSVQSLRKAWKELEKTAKIDRTLEKGSGQIGL